MFLGAPRVCVGACVLVCACFVSYPVQCKRELVALLQLHCGCLCFVSLPHGAMGWSTVYDCDIFGHTHGELPQPGPEVIKLFSCSTQIGMKCNMLVNVKMPTIVGILIL